MTPLLRRFALFILLGGLSIFLLKSLTTVSSGHSATLKPFSILSVPSSTDKTNSHKSAGGPPKQPVLPSIPWEQPTGKFKWRDVPIHYPIAVENQIPLPNGPAQPIPRIQHDFSSTPETSAHRAERERRLSVVLEAFQHSWEGYKGGAWLHDELKPLSGGSSDPFGGWGATLVDTLDTLWLMGLHDEFHEAVTALDQIDFSSSRLGEISTFETNIRYLGGFLSAYELSGSQYSTLLEKATEIGDMLYKSFDTPNRMPIPRWNWQAALQGKTQTAVGSAIIAEPASMSMEFTKLAQLTGDSKYYDAIARITDIMEIEQNKTLLPGLWPLSVNLKKEDWHSDAMFRLGGMADSAYEYLPKQYLLLGGRDERYRSMYLSALDTTKRYLAFQPLVPSKYSNPPPLILGAATVENERVLLSGRGEHLTCFSGGMVALGARLSSNTQSPEATLEDLSVAERLSEGCVWSYSATGTGVGPEIFITDPCKIGRDAITSGAEPDHTGHKGDCTYTKDKWMDKVWNKPSNDMAQVESWLKSKHLPEGMLIVPDGQYQLRPEAIESLFVLYRVTGNEKYQEQAWRMFEAINKWCRTSLAYAVMPDVKLAPESDSNMASGLAGGVAHDGGAGSGSGVPGGHDGGTKGDKIALVDKMESFWLAETLKYFYLIFTDPTEHAVGKGLPGGLDEWVFNTEAHPFRWRNKGDVPRSQ